jgi:hypothetical protein
MSNWINKIKLIWKGRSIATSLINVKSRWKEPTFWAALLSQVITVVGYAQGFLEPKVAMIITTVTTSLYNYVRGLQKAESDGVKPYASRSEFLLGLAAMAQNCFMGLHEQGLNPAWLAGTTIILGHAITAAEALQNMRPKEVTDAGVSVKAA